MPRLLYIGCLGYQNAGDDACWEGTQALLQPLLPGDWELTPFNGYDFRGNEEFDALLVGGGTLLSVHGNLADAAMHEAIRRGRPYAIFGTGVEGGDWESPAPESKVREFVELVSTAALVGVRGPWSKSYMVKLGVNSERVQVIGDPAVVLNPGPADETLFSPPAGRWVGVNVGGSFGRVYGWDEQQTQTAIVAAARELIREGWNVCLFPVWQRDLKVQASIRQRLGDESAVQLIEHVSKPTQIIAQLARLDAVIAMKLHAGIFAAVAGTPYLPWAYRPKVEDFAAALNLESLVVRTDVGADAILAAFSGLQQQAAQVREQIAAGIDGMRRRLVSFARQVVQSLVESN